MTKVLIFGTFDGIHEGHRSLFSAAKEYGDYLIVILARDKTILSTKGRLPLKNEEQRQDDLKEEDLVNEIHLGTEGEDKHDIIRIVAPDIILLGYDQEHFTDDLEISLRRYSLFPQIVRARAHKPEKYKSSLINDHHHSDPKKQI